MTEQEQQEVQALTKMFESEGWAVFIRSQSNVVENLRRNSWDSVKTLEQLHYMRGFLTALEGVVNYEKIIEAQQQQLQYDFV